MAGIPIQEELGVPAATSDAWLSSRGHWAEAVSSLPVIPGLDTSHCHVPR